MSLECHSVKVLIITSFYGNRSIASFHLKFEGSVYAMLLTDYKTLPEINTMEKCNFLRSVIHSQTI